MKLLRLSICLAVAMMTLGTGCQNKTVVVPTDDEAKKLAQEQPPPPISVSGSPNPEKGASNSKVTLRGAGGDNNKK